jgi:hypothetical protein
MTRIGSSPFAALFGALAHPLEAMALSAMARMRPL